MKNTKLKSIRAALAASGFVIASSIPAVSADLKYATFANVSHPILTEAVVPFFDRVKESTGGSVTGVVFPNGQLLGARAILGGIGDGVVDSGYIMPQFYPSDLKYNLVVANMVAYGEDPLAVAAAVNELVLLDCEQCQEEYTAHGSQLMVTFATTGYKFLCRSRVETLADLSGKRVRTTGIYGALVQDLGAVPVDIPVSDAAEALERGSVDCVLGPLEWLQAYGLQDSVKFVTEVSLGLNRDLGLLVAGKNRWNEMSDDEKAKFIAEMPGLAADGVLVYVKGEDKSREIAREAGVEFLAGDTAFQKAALPTDSSAADLQASASDLGVEDSAPLLATFQEKLAKWEKIVAEIGHDRDKYAEALWNEIYSRL